jgi:hypothetical protein
VHVVWAVLADVVWAAHVAFLVFLPLGGFLAWRWRKVAYAHGVAIAIGLVSITINFDCPLTTWEQWFRRRAGHPYTDGFIDHYFTGRVYPTGYQWVVWIVFGVCIVASYVHFFRTSRTDPRVAVGTHGRQVG